MDFRGEDYQDRFISSLVSFVSSETFQTMFEEFFVNHALEFTNDAEHKLRYHELYQNFHKMFDRQLEIFCDDMQLSQAEYAPPLPLPLCCTMHGSPLSGSCGVARRPQRTIRRPSIT